MRTTSFVLAGFVAVLLTWDLAAHDQRSSDEASAPIILKPARVFDGDAMHEGGRCA